MTSPSERLPLLSLTPRFNGVEMRLLVVQPLQWFPHPSAPPTPNVPCAFRVVECAAGFQGSGALDCPRLASPASKWNFDAVPASGLVADAYWQFALIHLHPGSRS
ncbi:MAG: hypothetical protein NTW03_02355 [Verrucomicrobia bacterium]|nr:hypothetical protein [Verrucomicrobiota bacterium]